MYLLNCISCTVKNEVNGCDSVQAVAKVQCRLCELPTCL